MQTQVEDYQLTAEMIHQYLDSKKDEDIIGHCGCDSCLGARTLNFHYTFSFSVSGQNVSFRKQGEVTRYPIPPSSKKLLDAFDTLSFMDIAVQKRAYMEIINNADC